MYCQGVSKVPSRKELREAVDIAFKHDSQVGVYLLYVICLVRSSFYHLTLLSIHNLLNILLEPNVGFGLDKMLSEILRSKCEFNCGVDTRLWWSRASVMGWR